MTLVMVARPGAQLPAAVRYLEERGFETVAATLIEPVPRADGAVGRALERIEGGEADAVVFTSQSGVRFAMDAARDREALAARLGAMDVVAIGPKTAAALRKAGVGRLLVPGVYSSGGIVAGLDGRLAGKRVEVLRSDRGSPELIAGLRRVCPVVNDTVVYDIVPVGGAAQGRLVELALAGRIDAYLFTSAMTVRSLLALAETPESAAELKAAMNRATVAAIGHPTAQCLRDEGIRIDVVPGRFTFEDMVDALVEHYRNRG